MPFTQKRLFPEKGLNTKKNPHEAVLGEGLVNNRRLLVGLVLVLHRCLEMSTEVFILRQRLDCQSNPANARAVWAEKFAVAILDFSVEAGCASCAVGFGIGADLLSEALERGALKTSMDVADEDGTAGDW